MLGKFLLKKNGSRRQNHFLQLWTMCGANKCCIQAACWRHNGGSLHLCESSRDFKRQWSCDHTTLKSRIRCSFSLPFSFFWAAPPPLRTPMAVAKLPMWQVTVLVQCGKVRLVLVSNGVLPGPSLVVCEGDSVIVRLGVLELGLSVLELSRPSTPPAL